MSAAQRLARLFELPETERAELEHVAKLIHQRHDLGAHWRPWWPRVDEVWRHKDKPPAALPEMHQQYHLQAWDVLSGIFQQYQQAKTQQNQGARAG